MDLVKKKRNWSMAVVSSPRVLFGASRKDLVQGTAQTIWSNPLTRSARPKDKPGSRSAAPRRRARTAPAPAALIRSKHVIKGDLVK